jgi:hypothetical protein
MGEGMKPSTVSEIRSGIWFIYGTLLIRFDHMLLKVAGSLLLIGGMIIALHACWLEASGK